MNVLYEMINSDYDEYQITQISDKFQVPLNLLT